MGEAKTKNLSEEDAVSAPAGEDTHPDAQPPISEEPPIPENRDELPGTPRPGERKH